MANTLGLLARLTRFCFWPIEGQWRASVSMPGHNVSEKQHGWKERPLQRLSISEAAACVCIGTLAQAQAHAHTDHDTWVRWGGGGSCNLAKDNGGNAASAHVGALVNMLTHNRTWALSFHVNPSSPNTHSPSHTMKRSTHTYTHTHTTTISDTNHSQKRWWRTEAQEAPLHLEE